MSTASMVRALAFAGPQLWGGLVATNTASALVLGAGATREACGPGAITTTVQPDGWTVSGAGTSLRISPADSDQPGQPCTVEGIATIGGVDHEVNCAGLRLELTGEAAEDAASLRAVAGWLGPELSLSLSALRRPDSRGHDRDGMIATLFEAGVPLDVDEPRLSTTIREGLPTRMSMELWIAEGDDLYPRRAAGEAAGAGAQTPSGTPRLAAVPMTCHMAGQDGVGVYLLADLT